MIAPETTEAFEIIGGHDDAPAVVTCEHASNRLPPPWRWPKEDHWLVDTHWAYDLGAAELARELAIAAHAPAVLARFSRLLADPNRPERAETLFRSVAEGEPIELNRKLDDAEGAERLAGYYRPYHEAINRTIQATSAPILFAVHTFTPVYEGERRNLEVGVLYDRDRNLAERLAERIAGDVGAEVALNEPYSGREGLIYAADRHARRHDRRAVEIEVRQDLAVRAEWRRPLVETLTRGLAAEAGG